MTKNRKDLPARKPVKGGGREQQDNITLVRAAKPKIGKDMPPKKTIKGGRAEKV